MKRLATGVGIVGVLAFSVVTFAARDASAVGNHRAHHWNMCGHVCQRDDPNVEYADSPAVVVYIAATSNPKPLAINLNEACFDQLAVIEPAMASLGYNYSANTRTVTKFDVSEDCGDFGNAVFHLGTFITSNSFTLDPKHPDENGSPTTEEVRRAICVRFNAIAKPVSCAGHATSKDDDIAEDQAADYHDTVQGLFAGRCRWITGDFNITPTYNSGTWLNAYSVAYDEVDQPSPWQSTHDSNTKIDYVWINDALHASDFDAVLSNVAPVSDHYYFKASLSFSATCP